jgi:CBS domain-containing protein
MSPQQPRRELCLSKNPLTRPLPLEPELDDIIAKMMEHHIIRLSVVGADGKLIGVIAHANLLRHLIEPEFVTVVGT